MHRTTSKERVEFAKLVTVNGMSYTDAFKKLYPNTTKSEAQIRAAANDMATQQGVAEVIKQYQNENACEEIITRRDLLTKLKKLIDECEKETYSVVVHGEVVPGFSTKNAEVLIKAFDRAAKLIGADAPDKVDNTVTITFDGDFGEYAN